MGGYLVDTNSFSKSRLLCCYRWDNQDGSVVSTSHYHNSYTSFKEWNALVFQWFIFGGT